jgi:predicted flap endonuclease-1-like 5' DNA nuclease
MFGLDPLSRPVAIVEMLLLLSLAAFIGWLLGRFVLSGRISALRADIADKESALADCERSKKTATVTPPMASPAPAPVATVVPPMPVVKPLPVVMPVVEVPPVEPIVTDSIMVMPPTAEPLTFALPALPDAPTFISEPTADLAAAPVFFGDTLSGSATAPEPAKTDNSEAAVLARISARAGELDFDRIGFATVAEADDLKDIVGVGPFLEKKLHSLGIYTFRQVANFTRYDIDKVNDIIEFFPGRIERDDWVGQSADFYEKKYVLKIPHLPPSQG